MCNNILIEKKKTLATAFERHLALEDSTEMDQHVLIFPWVNIMKRKWAMVPRKLSVVQNPEPVL